MLACLVSYAGCAAPAKSPRETPVVQVVRENAASVVNIRTESLVDLKEHPAWGQYGERLDRFFKQYFGEDYSEGTVKLKSLGSGVIIDKAGLIVTNAHVVHRATTIYAVLRDGTVAEAKIVKVNTLDDLALIRIQPANDLRAVRFADVKTLMIGETVVAIGNPLGLENSVTTGVISGINRAFKNHGMQLRLLGAVADGCLHQSRKQRRGAAEHGRRAGRVSTWQWCWERRTSASLFPSTRFCRC